MMHRLADMIGSPDCQAQTPYGWVRAVPLPFYGGLFDRLRDAWFVLSGRAYAVRWPESGELEMALTPIKGLDPKTAPFWRSEPAR